MVKPSQFAQAEEQGDTTGTYGRGPSDHTLWSFIVDLNFLTIKACGLEESVQQGAKPIGRPAPWSRAEDVKC